jgi:hypothetical protein
MCWTLGSPRCGFEGAHKETWDATEVTDVKGNHIIAFGEGSGRDLEVVSAHGKPGSLQVGASRA